MNKLLVVLGPTATGKTDLALSLAKKFNGELISCDSRQVYVGLDIGTGKYPSNSTYEVKRMGPRRSLWVINGVRVWMYDVVSPQRQYTVYDYVKDANRAIREIEEKGKLPIVVGGTGLYLKALLEGLPNLEIPVDSALRKRLEKLSKKQLQKKLQETSPDKWKRLNVSDRQNPRRLIRAIELSAVPIIGRLPRSLSLARDDTVKIGLIAPRKVLYKRVDERVVNRINQGMIDEVEKLHKNGFSFKRMKQLGLEYGVLADYLSGKIREIKGDQGLIKIMQNKIHGYVRRQMTWFKKEEDVFWFDIADKHFPKKLENMVSRWYDQSHVTKNRYLS